LVHWLPFLGRLPDCSKADLLEAAYEVGAATFFSTMPLWFLPFIGRFLFTSPPSLTEALATGGLFIYCAALAGPLVYIITKKYGSFYTEDQSGKRFNLSISFPYGGAFLCTLVVICVVSGFAFTILSNPSLTQSPISAVINQSGSISLSWFAFWICTVLLYCVTAYRNMLENVSKRQGAQEGAFYDQWMDEKK